MPEVLIYRCPFCNRDARVGEPCPGCVAKAGKKKRKATPDKSSGPDGGFDDDFDYDDFCKREFGKSPHHRTGLKWYWWCLAIIVLAGMAVAALWLG